MIYHFKFLFFLKLIIFLPFLFSCTSMHYIFQATEGQMMLLRNSRPISEVLKDETTSSFTKKILKEIEPIKKFGESRGLKPTQNYSKFVQLKKHSVVWAVSACEKLKFISKSWSFPLIGSFPYLGWFHEEHAQKYAQELVQEGWDVDVRGVSAYSTLGWFNDPVLSSMISEKSEYSLASLANIILHESVHATVHFPNQSLFNESIASFIADRLTIEYLEEFQGIDSNEKKAYLEANQKNEKIRNYFHKIYQDLEKIYLSQDSDEVKLVKKNQIISQLKKDFKIQKDINNATLIQFKLYSSSFEKFDKLFQDYDSNWRKFIEGLGKLKSEDIVELQE